MYTDYVALLMSSVTTIINAISYVLIAFVAISGSIFNNDRHNNIYFRTGTH